MNPLAQSNDIFLYFSKIILKNDSPPTQDPAAKILNEAAENTSKKGFDVIESLKENSLEACDYSLNKCGERVLLPIIQHMTQSEDNEQGCLKRLDTALFNYSLSIYSVFSYITNSVQKLFQ